MTRVRFLEVGRRFLLLFVGVRGRKGARGFFRKMLCPIRSSSFIFLKILHRNQFFPFLGCRNLTFVGFVDKSLKG